MNEINRSPDLEMVVLKEISSAIVNERNGTALLRHILDVLYRRMKMLRGTFTIRNLDFTNDVRARERFDD